MSGSLRPIIEVPPPFPAEQQKEPGNDVIVSWSRGRFRRPCVCDSLATLSAQTAGGQPQQTFRASADVVTIQASVRDGRGRVLSGLTPADFEVRDNGELREILSLRSDRQSPLSLALLVDMSGSMRVSAKVAMARQAYNSLLAELRQGQDEAAVFTFDSALHERQPFTTDRRSSKACWPSSSRSAPPLSRRDGRGRAAPR